MSSFSTATSRATEKDPPSGKPIHLLVNPDGVPEVEAPQTEPLRSNDAPQRADAASAQTQTLDEVDRVERLISQLEARSMALVPYGYGNLREVPQSKSKTGLIAGVIAGLWVTTLVLALGYMRYVGHLPFAAERAAPVAAAAPPSVVIAPDPDPQEQKVAASVDHLARALVSSSERMTELQVAMEKSNRDLQKLATKVNAERPGVAAPAQSTDQVQVPIASGTGGPATLPKNWHRVLDLKPSENSVPHKGADGNTDYWLVPRGLEATMNKVLPIGNSADGVVIHSLEDGKDYTVTPTGEWKNGALANSSGN